MIKRGAKRLTKQMKGKLRFVIFVIFALFCVLVCRLLYWTFQNGDKFKTIVLGQQNHTSQTIAYERGEILDRNGNILATNEKLYRLVLEPKNILLTYKGKYKYEETTLNALKKYFNLDKKEMKELIESDDNKNKYYLTVDGKKSLTYDEVAPFKEFISYASKSSDGLTEEEKKIKEAASLVQGITFEEYYQRIYPYDSLACRLLGFTSDGNSGNWGIEQEYNDTLNGTDGRSYYNFDDELIHQETVIEPVNGDTVVSTIDMRIQDIIENAIATFDDNIGSNGTSILVMNPQNGEVLGMASSNPYNLNDPSGDESLLEYYYSDKQIAKMKKNTEEKKKAANKEALSTEATTEVVTAEDADSDSVSTTESATTESATTESKSTEYKPTLIDGFYKVWRNPIISNTFEPGSTYKPFTVCSALESGKLQTNSWTCEGSYPVDGRNIGCSHVHGTVNMKQAIAQSCNVAMMSIAFEIGPESFYKYQSMFGFGSKTGIDLPGESSAEGLLYNADTYENSASLATNSFGQNFNCTMIQMAAGFSSLINGGYYYKPHVVKEIQNDNGDVIEEKDKELVKYTVSKSTSDTIKSYLKEVVTSGTGVKAKISGYSIGGKTGTAEKLPRDKENYFVSFIGFTSVDDPQLLIYVTIDEPNVKDQASAALAVLLEKECMSQIVDYMGIEPTEKKSKNTSTSDYVDEYTKLFNKAFGKDN